MTFRGRIFNNKNTFILVPVYFEISKFQDIKKLIDEKMPLQQLNSGVARVIKIKWENLQI